MSPLRPLATAIAALGLALGASRARAGDPPRRDASPLTGKATKDPVLDGQVRAVDAAGRQAAATARSQALAPHSAPEPGLSPVAAGRAGLGIGSRPNYALDQLRNMEMKTTGLALEPTPETVRVIAAEAWGASTESWNDVVVVQPRRGTPFFEGSLRPATIDDAPAVLRVYRSLDRGAVPSPGSTDPKGDPKGPATPPPAAATPFDRLVKGVLVRIDDVALSRALSSFEAPVAPEDLEALEGALLAAKDEADAARRLEAHARRWIQKATSPANSAEPDVRSVSLRDLLDRAAPWRGRWAQRPPEVRTVGGLTRLVGVVVDERTKDVRLLGRADPGAPALGLDDLSVGLAAAWRDGLSPACTLDPMPQDVSGPQHAHVFGVPRDSTFSKTMLEADYAMKRLLFGAPGDRLEIPGWRSAADVHLASLEPGSVGQTVSRHWLYPVQPRPGSVLLASDGRSALFRSSVQVLTEAMVAGERGFSGTGTPDPDDAAAALSFTEHYDEIAAQRPVFRRLSALFDVVLAARILHLLAPDHPVLRDVCALPYERVDVPASYPGVVVTTSNDRGWVTLTGGCDVSTRTRRRSTLALPDAVAARLAAGGAPGSLPAVPSDAGASRAIEEAHAVGLADVARGDADAALLQADRMLDADPSLADGYSLRASARLLQRDFDGARRDVAAALLLEPEDLGFSALERRILLEEGAPEALEGLSPALRAECLRGYLHEAAAAVSEMDAKRALAASARAVQVDPSAHAAWFVSAVARLLADDVPTAEEAVDRAIAAAPDDAEARSLRAILRLRRGDAAKARADLDHALAKGGAADLYGWRALASLLTGDLEAAATDVEAGLRLAPRSLVLAGAARYLQVAAGAPAGEVRRSIEEMLRLPLRADVAVQAAFAAAEAGRTVEAARETERALAALDEAKAPKDLAYTRVELQLLALLPAAAREAGAGEDVRARVESLDRSLRERHPDFASVRFARALARLHLGEPEEAYRALESAASAARAGGDPLLREMLASDPREAVGLFRIVQVAVLLTTDPAARDPRLRTLVGEIEEILGARPAKAAAEGLRAFFDVAGQDLRATPRLEPLRRHVAALERAGIEDANLLEATTVALFASFAARLEAVVGETAEAERAARVLWRIRPEGEFSPIARSLLPQFRAGLVKDLAERWIRDSKAQAEKRRGLGGVESDANQEAVARVQAARAFGEPAFLLRIEDAFGREAEDTDRAKREARAAHLQRLVPLADPGPKRDRLAADLAALEKTLRPPQDVRREAIRARVATAYRGAETLTQLRTIDRVLLALAAASAEDAAAYAQPEDMEEVGRRLTLRSALGRHRKGGK